VDAPLHFVAHGAGTEALDLDTLIGRTLVVELPGTNITGRCSGGGRAMVMHS
jgi:kynurenine formamidase